MDEIPFSAPHLFRALAKVNDLTDPQFAVLLEASKEPGGFDRQAERCEDLASKLGGIQVDEVFQLLSGLAFLYYRCRQWEADTPDRPYVESLKQFLSFSGLARQVDLGKVLPRLDVLLSKNPTVERRQKRQRLSQDLLDTATGFSSLVDLRPHLNAERSEIEELIPVVLFKVEFEKSDGEDTAFACQMDLATFRRLQTVVTSIDRKLALLKSTDLRVATYWGGDSDG
jgi:hypothetical protein